MLHPNRDTGIVRHMIDDRHAHADSERLARLARGHRARRPSLLQRLGGHVASFRSALPHRPVTRDTAPTTRP